MSLIMKSFKYISPINMCYIMTTVILFSHIYKPDLAIMKFVYLIIGIIFPMLTIMPILMMSDKETPNASIGTSLGCISIYLFLLGGFYGFICNDPIILFFAVVCQITALLIWGM